MSPLNLRFDFFVLFFPIFWRSTLLELGQDLLEVFLVLLRWKDLNILILVCNSIKMLNKWTYLHYFSINKLIDPENHRVNFLDVNGENDNCIVVKVSCVGHFLGQLFEFSHIINYKGKIVAGPIKLIFCPKQKSKHNSSHRY